MTESDYRAFVHFHLHKNRKCNFRFQPGNKLVLICENRGKKISRTPRKKWRSVKKSSSSFTSEDKTVDPNKDF